MTIVIPRTRYERAHPRDTVWRTRRKTALLSGLLGWLAILIYPAFLLIDCFAKIDHGTSNLKLALISMAAGLVLMGISMILQPPTRRVGTPQYRWRKWICPYRDVGSLTTSMAGGQSRAGGAVLVLVLVVVALSSTLILDMQITARSRLKHTRAVMDHMLLRLAAADAIRSGMERLRADEETDIDHLGEAWAMPLQDTDPMGIKIRVEIEDLNRYFDLNNLALKDRPAIRSPGVILTELLRLHNVPGAMNRANAVRDWVDSDEDGDYESGLYRALDSPYLTAGRLLYNWQELVLVEGFDQTDFRAKTDAEETGRLTDALTLIPATRNNPVKVNVNTAGPAVLEAVMGRQQKPALKKLLEQRERRPLRPEDMGQITVDPALAQKLSAYLSVQSKYFRIRSRVSRGDRARWMQALVRRDTAGNMEVLDWIQ